MQNRPDFVVTLGVVIALASAALTRADLVVSAVEQAPSGERVLVSQPYGRRGPTSIRYFPADGPNRKVQISPNPADPNGGAFYVHDRDMGQIFRTPAGKPVKLDAITLRVGARSNPDDKFENFYAGALGAKVSLQLLKVEGEPKVNDNGTTGNVIVSEGYKRLPETVAMADDFITGLRFTTLAVARGGVLPQQLRLARGNSHTGTTEATGTILRWDLTGDSEITLEPDTRYAFMVMFDEPAVDRALPLDNFDYIQNPPRTTAGEEGPIDWDKMRAGPYADGHALRRAGSINQPWESPDKLEQMFNGKDATRRHLSAFPTDWQTRLNLAPGTWGRPDVDTYRDLAFFIEADPIP
jgi:hypothetical protein